MTKYEKGVRRERQTLEWLEEQGYKFHTRTPGSHGPFDVLACNGWIWRLIQVKCNKGPAMSEVEKIKAVEVPPNTSREIWVWRDRNPVPEVRELGPIFIHSKDQVA